MPRPPPHRRHTRHLRRRRPNRTLRLRHLRLNRTRRLPLRRLSRTQRPRRRRLNPMPRLRPAVLLLKNGSKARLSVVSSIPEPLSDTVMATRDEYGSNAA